MPVLINLPATDMLDFATAAIHERGGFIWIWNFAHTEIYEVELDSALGRAIVQYHEAIVQYHEDGEGV